MDADRFDAFVRAISSRRAAVGGLLGTGLAAALDQIEAARTSAKRKKKKNQRKKRTLCLNGQTIKASKKKRKKLLKNGATPGACPPPPSGCTPSCPGDACGIADGCGGICACAANAICRDGRCLACTVTDASGLPAALEAGGEVVVCPGLYVGTHVLNRSVTVIGAGDGDDSATNTILDAKIQGRVVTIAAGITVTLRGLRITGGLTANGDDGAGLLNEGTLTLGGCTVAANRAGGSGGGIAHTGDGSNRLTLDGCTISGNSSGEFGGGIDNGCPATINSSLISGNDAELDGGGIFNNDAVTINASTITGNRTVGDGGGLFNSGDATFDSGSAVVDNDADGVGGGIFTIGMFATVELNGANVSGNEPDQCVGVVCPA